MKNMPYWRQGKERKMSGVTITLHLSLCQMQWMNNEKCMIFFSPLIKFDLEGAMCIFSCTKMWRGRGLRWAAVKTEEIVASPRPCCFWEWHGSPGILLVIIKSQLCYGHLASSVPPPLQFILQSGPTFSSKKSLDGRVGPVVFDTCWVPQTRLNRKNISVLSEDRLWKYSATWSMMDKRALGQGIIFWTRTPNPEYPNPLLKYPKPNTR